MTEHYAPLPLFDKLPARAFHRWADFHRANPDVFAHFLRYAREATAAGRGRMGARAIGERIRWYVAVETRSADGFKVNNDFWPYYGRLAMLLYPEELGGLFERRDGRFDGSDAELLKAHRGQ